MIHSYRTAQHIKLNVTHVHSLLGAFTQMVGRVLPSVAKRPAQLVWGEAVRLKPDANSLTLDQSTATAIN
jgi:hypothetical protein